MRKLRTYYSDPFIGEEINCSDYRVHGIQIERLGFTLKWVLTTMNQSKFDTVVKEAENPLKSLCWWVVVGFWWVLAVVLVSNPISLIRLWFSLGWSTHLFFSTKQTTLISGALPPIQQEATHTHPFPSIQPTAEVKSWEKRGKFMAATGVRFVDAPASCSCQTAQNILSIQGLQQPAQKEIYRVSPY